MDRVSSQMTPRDMQYYMRRNGVRSNELANKVAGNTRVLDPRDNPSAASHSVLLSSKIDRLQTFVENAEQMKDDIRLAENSLQQANAILHEVRRLAVTAANGTYSDSDRKIMANQLNEYLYGLIDLANTRNEDGIALFSGTRRSPDRNLIWPPEPGSVRLWAYRSARRRRSRSATGRSLSFLWLPASG